MNTPSELTRSNFMNLIGNDFRSKYEKLIIITDTHYKNFKL